MARAPRMTLREWRTAGVNRLLGGTRLQALVSDAKWRVYPQLVRRLPRLAILAHEPESTGAFWDALHPGAIAVDAGANMGGYSILAAERVGPTGRVFAFEPAPANFARLQARLRAFPQVEPVQAALGGEVGFAELNLDDFHASHTLVAPRSTGRTVRVPLTTLDHFAKVRGLARIDVVKLDVEGVELDVLRGMHGLLSSKHPPVILCEVHAPIEPEQWIAALAPYGYRTRLLDAELTGRAHEAPVHALSRPENG